MTEWQKHRPAPMPGEVVPGVREITHTLNGLPLPQTKGGIIQYARLHHAETDVMDILNDMPDRSYETLADVIHTADRANLARHGFLEH